MKIYVFKIIEIFSWQSRGANFARIADADPTNTRKGRGKRPVNINSNN